MVESIQTLIAQTHYQLVVDYMDEDENEVRRAAQLCREKEASGHPVPRRQQREFHPGFRGH